MVWIPGIKGLGFLGPVPRFESQTTKRPKPTINHELSVMKREPKMVGYPLTHGVVTSQNMRMYKKPSFWTGPVFLATTRLAENG